ncbi:MAG TPA: carboxypeptidase-like regulatory domain-containing protein [Pirellulales bacterium]|nr:carboxypeptidase-like regulatory domain-containing protein [Pirellulales bacterium]
MSLASLGLHNPRLAFGILVAWSLSAAPGRTEETPHQGTLSGRIVDAEGTPVAGATVSINTWGDKEPVKLFVEGVSGADGRFTLGPADAVYRHSFDIIIEGDGFARQYVPGGAYSVFPNADCELGVIRVDRGCSFSGLVLDHDGTPLADALVEPVVDRRYLGHTITGAAPMRPVRTDAEGRFRTPGIPVGERVILVRVPHRQLAWVVLPDAPHGERTLPPIVVERDVPILGRITDGRGEPVAGVVVQANAESNPTTSDAEGRFVLSGFGPNPRFQLQAKKDGYVFINWGVKGSDDGFHWHEVGAAGKEHGPVRQLSVVMQPVVWIEGEAIDEATGEPVRLDRVVLCFFERKPNGEVVLDGCRNSRFEQPQNGRFRVPYSTPEEYHLTFSAKGYHDAEAFTPKVDALASVEGIRVKLRKKIDGSTAQLPRQTIIGSVTDHGRPVETGWVALWSVRPSENIVNAYIMRGRTVTADAAICASAPIQNGKYVLTAPFQGDAFYLVAESPERAPTQIGPLEVALGEAKSLDIACVEGGAVQGTVKDRPSDWEDDLWVVAFTDTGVRVETRVLPDGSFSLANLPPVRYGLKVGHDAYRDSEVPRGPNIPPEARETNSDPWKRAVVVNVSPGEERDAVELRLPKRD